MEERQQKPYYLGLQNFKKDPEDSLKFAALPRGLRRLTDVVHFKSKSPPSVTSRMARQLPSLAGK